MKKPDEIVEKVAYKCHDCGSLLRRKATEPPPHNCNYCHSEAPAFTVVVDRG